MSSIVLVILLQTIGSSPNMEIWRMECFGGALELAVTVVKLLLVVDAMAGVIRRMT
jgi:hypothetical protein